MHLTAGTSNVDWQFAPEPEEVELEDDEPPLEELKLLLVPPPELVLLLLDEPLPDAGPATQANEPVDMRRSFVKPELHCQMLLRQHQCESITQHEAIA